MDLIPNLSWAIEFSGSELEFIDILLQFKLYSIKFHYCLMQND